MMRLCLLASLIKTRPMPCVARVLMGGEGQRFRATQLWAPLTPGPLRLTAGGHRPTLVWLFYSDLNIPGGDSPSFLCPFTVAIS